ncbi:AAA family ATPase [Mycobacterium sp. MYCO198283]|uniref:polysaccharide biosynthesis tyrosine autokinase n=1 Tax=Mycobacterium sp. MYCO198283 TaxID=2883505 RepID=UPI001E3AAFEA|nr:polysaccharide biosynthesis tyrosine autokinase [Mycobacterium sp. MYCO198283]MCG5433886.1 AAA family ATPase [Mycobacterium sp. MYCO198283]
MDFRTFVRIVAARWRVAVLALVVCLLGAGAVTVLQTKTYEASATILMSFSGTTTVNEAFEATQVSQQRLSSYADIAGGRTVAQRAIDQLGLPLSVDELMKKTTVSYAPDSTVFTLTVADSDPERVAMLASAMANQFTALVPEIEATVRGQPAATQASATVVERPVVPEHAVSPNPVRNLALGLVAGVLVAIIAALIRNTTDRTVRTREQVDEITGLPTLAALPGPDGGKTADAWFGAGGPMDEEMRGFRARLRNLSGQQTRTLLVTAPACGAGTTTTALNLALAFAETGEYVLLVEGDTRQAVIADLVGVRSENGLADVLANRDALDYAICSTPYANLYVLAANEPAGTDPNFGAPVLPEILEKMTGLFDRIIVDGPPTLATADSGLLSAACRATVLVVRAGRSTLDDVETTLHDLRAAGGKVIGTVLTAAPVPRHTKAAARAYQARVGSTA